MNKGPTEAVICPSCEKILFKVVPIEQPDGSVIPSGVTTNPEINKDGKGSFMKCPHCSKRIPFKMVSHGLYEIDLAQFHKEYPAI